MQQENLRSTSSEEKDEFPVLDLALEIESLAEAQQRV